MAKILMIQMQPAPYVGTAYLNGAALSSGHKFTLHVGSRIKNILDAVDREQPDLIGFSCTTGIHKEALEISGEIKRKHKIPVIMGGSHPTLFPEVINHPAIDIICRGEGEFALIDLLNAFENKKIYTDILNLWLKADGKIHRNNLRRLAEPLDTVPLINWSCYRNTPVQKSAPIAFPIRGCPYSCSYCFNEKVRGMYSGLGSYIRYFSVERAVQEIEEALKVFSRSPVVFSSDTFGVDLDWTDKLFARYSEVTDLPFALLMRPELVTEQYIRIVSKYKCHMVAIGVESGSERVRREIMNRKYSNELLLKVAKNLHAAGIKFRSYNIIGLPTETEDEMWETIELNIKMKTDFPRASIFTPFPNTAITEMAKKYGYLDEDFNFDAIPANILSRSILKKINHHTLQNTLYFFQTAIMFPRLKSLLRRLTRVKPNPLFRMWFYFMYVCVYGRSEARSPVSFMQYLWANRKYR